MTSSRHGREATTTLRAAAELTAGRQSDSPVTSGALRHTVPQVAGFDPSWRSFAAVQGGLVAGYMLQAADDVVAGSPRTSSTHFLGPVVPGTPVSAEVLPDRTAGTSSYRVELRQGLTLVAVTQGLHVRLRAGGVRTATQTFRLPVRPPTWEPTPGPRGRVSPSRRRSSSCP